MKMKRASSGRPINNAATAVRRDAMETSSPLPPSPTVGSRGRGFLLAGSPHLAIKGQPGDRAKGRPSPFVPLILRSENACGCWVSGDAQVPL